MDEDRLSNIYYFIDERGNKPVEEFIRTLPKKERAKIEVVYMRKIGKVGLENIDVHLKEELKNKEFKRLYEIECAKVSLAQKIAELRQDKHLKQTDLAKRLGVTQQFISQIETAEERNLTIETLIKIAKSLGRGVKISFPKLSSQHHSYLKVT